MSRGSTKPKQWTRADIPDLSGKVAIVTGGSRGIGHGIVVGLLAAGAEVTIAGKSEERGNAAVAKILGNHPSAKVSFLQVDLGNLASITEFARTFNGSGVGLDILVNNAGIHTPSRETTTDGFEAVFGTNHLGHFALTAQLMPSLMRRHSANRIVNVSSVMASWGKVDFEDVHWETKKYSETGAYAQSKLCNLLFSRELQRRSDQFGWGVTVIPVHPGLVGTDMNRVRREDPPLVRWMDWLALRFLSQSVAEGADSALLAATWSEAKSSEYYVPKGLLSTAGPPVVKSLPSLGKDEDTAAKLWELSLQLTKVSWPD